VTACFGAIRKKNASIRKTNSNKRCRWVDGSTWAALGCLQGSAISESLSWGDSEKECQHWENQILTNDAAGSTEALGQHLGSCEGAQSVRACFGAIRKKNANIRKTNSNKRCSWVSQSTWVALGLLKGRTISNSLFWGDSEKECQHSENQF